ncbi:MAG: alcohol dehydrogenase catalytic domain-containing protein [Chloroflexi bacterium]|nr:alcohol dehydrogenase catalytic domain-containing protein [Chloroflexota bacterium]
MKALVKKAHGVGQVELLEVPRPQVGPRDVLLRVAACGICGTDLLIVEDKVDIYRPPVILGHNVAGVVAEVGPEVSGVAPGERAAVDMNVGACGHCAYCLSGREYLCAGRKGLGYGIDGGMAEYLALDERFVVKVPDGVSLAEAAAMDFCNAVHSVVDRTGGVAGKSVVIYGPGFQGLSMLQVARLEGAGPVVMVGRRRHAERLQLAKRLGADFAVASDEQDVGELVRDLTDGLGADVALETTGAPSALNEAIHTVRKGGTIAMLGSLPADALVDMHTVVYSEITLSPVRGYNAANVAYFVEALRLGKIDLQPFIKSFPLEEWEQAFAERQERRVIEPLLVPRA